MLLEWKLADHDSELSASRSPGSFDSGLELSLELSLEKFNQLQGALASNVDLFVRSEALSLILINAMGAF
ncbi:MAG: hypothetical protein ACI835_000680 [Planctomycetota bacterium]